MMRRRGPGLLGTMVIAGGTAAAVNKSSQNKQAAAANAQATQQQLADQQAQIDQLTAQQQPAAAPAPAPEAAPAAAPAGDDLVEQLQQLAALKTAGVLSDAEFDAAKAKLLGA